jgi:S1-C subfamily serine protease
MSGENSSTEIEERKFELDAEVRRREIALKEAESKKTGISVAQATIAGSVIALVSGVLGALIAAWSSENIEFRKSRASLDIEKLKVEGDLKLEESKQKANQALEQKKFETTLILEAIKTPSRSDAIRNLKFFVAAGFVADPDNRITKLSDESLPSIGMPSPESSGRALRATGEVVVVRGDNGSTVTCTGVGVSPIFILTASHCVAQNADVGLFIHFRVGTRKFPVRLIMLAPQSDLAFLKIASDEQLEVFLDLSRVREPLIGERVYFAVRAPDQTVQLRVCNIVKVDDRDFEHDCATSEGSAGAVVIGVSDDSLLGIHYGTRDSMGVAAKALGVLEKLYISQLR